MQLYLSFTSPYARKVRIALLEKGIAFDVIDVATSTDQPNQHNPLGKVPTLILDDGTALFDSVVIVEYLDLVHPAPQLIPSAPRERALVRRWEALADGICDVLVPAVLEQRRPAERQDPAYLAKLEGKVSASLALLERGLEGKRYLHDDEFGLADIAVCAALGYVNLRRPAMLDGFAEIARYVAFLLTRHSLQSTLPPNLPARG
jgi:glutathione S-transferase